MPYKRPRGEHHFASVEREILEYWREHRVFERSLEKNAGGERFVFYEGPPTANGLPHNGHVLTRVIKDLFPRYQAMRGRDVPRKGGWDTHGLPVEVEVEKELGIHGKAEIEAYGVEPFTRRCIDSVFRYTEEWEKLTERIGFWVNLPDAYVTYHRSYVESVWWALSMLFDKGLLYRGHKVVWWWPQGGTALSSGEVGQGYREVDDPEIVVRFASRTRPGVSYLAWTTTPWTLPSNVALAVKPTMEYTLAEIERQEGEGERVIVASALAPKLFGEDGWREIERFRGEELLGEAYEPVFDYAEPENGRSYEVIPADFVGAEQGTGVVHCAPAFGEDDFAACREHGMGFLQLVEPDGTFSEAVGDFAGRFCKKADRDIIRMMRERGQIFAEGTYRHDYPFCWRASDDPLIQYARPAWFIRTTEEIERAISNNRKINWRPEGIREGRFGDFLSNNVDWALSRERYWGTPLPIWICDRCEKQEAVDHLDRVLERNPNALDHWKEALERDPELSPHLVVHKPWVDEVTFPCAACEGTMRRVPEVIDCWFDSGCMPFAQWGFPHTGRDEFAKAFPADFISEAIDQTRGWFYSLLMISTLIFDEETQKKYGLEPVREFPHPYKSCIVLGHVCDPEGKKESKSSGNYTSPDLVLEGEFQMTVASEQRLKTPPAEDAVVFLSAQVKTLGLPEGAKLTLRSVDDPSRHAVASIASGPAGKEAVVLGSSIRAALNVEAGDRVSVHVLDDPPGADAFRWFFYSAGPPWNNTRNSLRAIREKQNEFLVRWSNVLSFFLIYASIDRFDPAEGLPLDDGKLPDFSSGRKYRTVAERPLLDRWILSELALTARRLENALDAYSVHEAAAALEAFVDGLSNWYVRRNRDRFWGSDADAYWTLFEVQVRLAQLASPFVPFFSEHVWKTLVVEAWPEIEADSVHLSSWPEIPSAYIDEELSSSMSLARDVVSLGLSERASARIRVRQPLRRTRVFLADERDETRLESMREIIAEELNVKEVRLGGDADAYVTWQMKPNFRAMGPRYGKLVPAIKKALGEADAAQLRRQLDADGRIRLEVEGREVICTSDDVAITLAAKEHYAAASSSRAVVVLEVEIDEELLREGLARELVNRIQTTRKDIGLDFVDRIDVTVSGDEEIAAVLEAHGEFIARETLAVSLEWLAPRPGARRREVDLDGRAVILGICRVEEPE